MNNHADSWIDRDLCEILDTDDKQIYYDDRRRQKPLISRAQAAALRRQEAEFHFIQWLMVDRFGSWTGWTFDKGICKE